MENIHLLYIGKTILGGINFGVYVEICISKCQKSMHASTYLCSLTDLVYSQTITHMYLSSLTDLVVFPDYPTPDTCTSVSLVPTPLPDFISQLSTAAR